MCQLTFWLSLLIFVISCTKRNDQQIPINTWTVNKEVKTAQYGEFYDIIVPSLIFKNGLDSLMQSYISFTFATGTGIPKTGTYKVVQYPNLPREVSISVNNNGQYYNSYDTVSASVYIQLEKKTIHIAGAGIFVKQLLFTHDTKGTLNFNLRTK